MKRNFFSIRAAVTAIGAMCGAIMIPSISHANAVLVNNATVCPSSASAASMSLTPAGDLNITCGTGTGAPVCSVSTTSNSLTVNGSATLTANCTPTPTSYIWTLGGTGGGPAISGAFSTLTFPAAGTYTYAVTGNNGTSGPMSAAVSITVGTVTAGPPVCSVTASPNSIVAGGSSSIGATCNPAATSYAWTTTGPAIGNTASAVLTFPTTGTFSYSVIGSNGTGPGVASQAAAVTVNPAGSCVAKAVAGAYTGNSTKLVAIDRGSSVTYSLPMYTAVARTIEIMSIQSTASQSDLSAEFSISTCPGDFDNMPQECKTWGTVNTSGTILTAVTWGTQYPGSCTLVLGTQYYINVRNTKYDKVTPACSVQTCYMNVQLNSY